MPVQKAFAGPLELRRRIGRLRGAEIATMDAGVLESAFRAEPALAAARPVPGTSGPISGGAIGARQAGGTCYGDSGGPHFLGTSTVVVAGTVTGDRFCRATDTTYRLDTPWARAFLGQFVALP